MLALIQRVSSASVEVNNETVGSIANGLLVYVGIAKTDTVKDAQFIARKISGLRIFEDQNGKLNLSLDDIKGKILLVSNFTLQANTRKGRRPSFDDAAGGESALQLFEHLLEAVRKHGIETHTGVFGADMLVKSVNDGPINMIVSSRTE